MCRLIQPGTYMYINYFLFLLSQLMLVAMKKAAKTTKKPAKKTPGLNERLLSCFTSQFPIHVSGANSNNIAKHIFLNWRFSQESSCQRGPG